MNHRRGIFCEGVAGSKPKASTWNDPGCILDVLVPALRSDQEAEATLFGLHEPAPQLAFLLLNIYVYYIYICWNVWIICIYIYVVYIIRRFNVDLKIFKEMLALWLQNGPLKPRADRSVQQTYTLKASPCGTRPLDKEGYLHVRDYGDEASMESFLRRSRSAVGFRNKHFSIPTESIVSTSWR